MWLTPYFCVSLQAGKAASPGLILGIARFHQFICERGEEDIDRAARERIVVHMAVENLDPNVWVPLVLQSFQQCAIRRGRMERTVGPIERGYASEGEEHGHWTSRDAEFLGYTATNLGVFLWRRAHEVRVFA